MCFAFLIKRNKPKKSNKKNKKRKRRTRNKHEDCISIISNGDMNTQQVKNTLLDKLLCMT